MESKNLFDRTIDYTKNNVLKVSIIFILVVVVVMLFAYVIKFAANGTSDEPSDWAYFGSYLGSITGLLAFAGVLYSINESRKQSKQNEERSLFFKHIELHQKQVASVLQIKVADINSDVAIGDIIIEHTIIAIIYDYIISNKIDDIKDELIFYDELVKGISETLSKESEQLSLLQLQMAIRFYVHIKSIKIPKKILQSDKNTFVSYLDWAVEIMSKKSNKEFYSYSFKIINYTANSLLRIYGHIFSAYISNILNIMEFAHSSTNPKYYSQFFISQITTPELVLILYYSVSKEGSNELINYLKETNLLMKFDLAYFVFFSARIEGITEPNKIKLFIEKLFEIYKLKQIASI
jgi:hypothetical protein